MRPRLVLVLVLLGVHLVGCGSLLPQTGTNAATTKCASYGASSSDKCTVK
jgi:hypothetical protein